MQDETPEDFESATLSDIALMIGTALDELATANAHLAEIQGRFEAIAGPQTEVRPMTPDELIARAAAYDALPIEVSFDGRFETREAAAMALEALARRVRDGEVIDRQPGSSNPLQFVTDDSDEEVWIDVD